MCPAGSSRTSPKGYKQRVGIAQALLGDPEVIILDEPTVGLDPRQIIEIRELIQSLGKDHTVILSSHILSEVQTVCQTILILSKGKLVACDTAENLERLFAGTASVELRCEAEEGEVWRLLTSLPHVTRLEVQPDGGSCCRVRIDTDADAGDQLCRAVFFAFSRAGRPILRMATVKASLEDIFLELTAGDGADSAPARKKTTQRQEVDET